MEWTDSQEKTRRGRDERTDDNNLVNVVVTVSWEVFTTSKVYVEGRWWIWTGVLSLLWRQVCNKSLKVFCTCVSLLHLHHTWHEAVLPGPPGTFTRRSCCLGNVCILWTSKVYAWNCRNTQKSILRYVSEGWHGGGKGHTSFFFSFFLHSLHNH